LPTPAQASSSQVTTPTTALQSTSTQWREMTLVEKQIEVLGPHPCVAPIGFKWIPNCCWKLVSDVEPSTPIANSSFEQLYLEKLKKKAPSKEKRKRKLDLRAKVYK